MYPLQQEDELRHKAAMEKRERQHRAEWEASVSEKQRLAVMRADEASFRKSIMDRRTAEFEALAVRCRLAPLHPCSCRSIHLLTAIRCLGIM